MSLVRGSFTLHSTHTSFSFSESRACVPRPFGCTLAVLDLMLKFLRRS